MGTSAVVTTILSTANWSAVEVKPMKGEGAPLNERDPSGRRKPTGIVPIADAVPPKPLESNIDAEASLRTNEKLMLVMG
jgi:hypothetical protein